MLYRGYFFVGKLHDLLKVKFLADYMGLLKVLNESFKKKNPNFHLF